jgi:hypothetical protein
MITSTSKHLSLEEFLALPETDIPYELVDGAAIPKFASDEMSPKFFRGSTTGALFILLIVKRYPFHLGNIEESQYLASGMPFLEPIEPSVFADLLENSDRFERLNRFLKATFSDLRMYRFCFWDYEHLYFLDANQTHDKAGIVMRSQFNYNP